MQWFRLYDDVLDDPKVQQLKPDLFKHWVNLLCLANKNDPRGYLPPEWKDIAFRLRVSPKKAVEIVRELVALELIDEGSVTFRPHNWDERQRKSDNVAERVAKHRSNVTGNVTETPHVTPPDTDTEAESETEQKQTPTTTSTETPPTPSRGKRKTPLTDLPHDFAVTDRMREWAKERHHLSDAEIDGKTEHFLNYVEKTGKQYAKWDAAWRDSMGWENRGSPQPLRPPLPDGVTWDRIAELRNRIRGGYPVSDDDRRMVEQIDGKAAA